MHFGNHTIHKATLLFCLLFSITLRAQQSAFRATKGLRFNFGPSISFYRVNKQHAKLASSNISALAGFKKEWKLDKDNRNFFLTGVDYFFHGLSFNSYFFYPDTLQLYDKSFSYNYSLFIHELHLPLQLKFLSRRRANKLFSSYIQVAYHLRYLLTSDLRITQNGAKVKYDSPELSFKNPLINKHLNSFLGLSYGLQKNSTGPSKGNFFVELNFKYGFSPYSFERDYAASSLFISSSHLSLIMGLKL